MKRDVSNALDSTVSQRARTFTNVGTLDRFNFPRSRYFCAIFQSFRSYGIPDLRPVVTKRFQLSLQSCCSLSRTGCQRSWLRLIEELPGKKLKLQKHVITHIHTVGHIRLKMCATLDRCEGNCNSDYICFIAFLTSVICFQRRINEKNIA